MNVAEQHTGLPMLDSLVEGLLQDAVPALPVAGLSADSRAMEPGAVFLACRGARSHGLDHLPEALAAGAAAVVWEPAGGVEAPIVPESVISIALPDLGSHVGEIAARFFGRPSRRLRLAGITGTNGKSTCAHLIATSLERCGRSCGYLGTLGYGRPQALRNAALTTADAVTLQRRLAGFVADGVRHAAMEVSSHALDQGRVGGVHFDTAVFTNLSRDHLDYHGSRRSYASAKARLFTQCAFDRAVINTGDPFGRELISRIDARRELVAVALETPESGRNGEEVRRLTAAGDRRYVQGALVRADARGIQIRFTSSWGAGTLRSSLLGAFNGENLLLSLAVMLGWQLPLDEALAGLADAAPAPGRMERFGGGNGPLAIVDFAHTPAALARALQAARATGSGQVWCVFGCGGERDRGKRGLMGEIAEQHADRIVITDDNPRGEDAERIVRDIQSGMANPAAASVERDREAAITFALESAQAGDIVLVAGKGHETFQLTGDERRAFSDRDVVARLTSARS
ncbi:UDP-N-acetylmuramoyl-L-alanyl-D-glutamate--2,6-diaminopimelate ligase [soil metagenome]